MLATLDAVLTVLHVAVVAACVTLWVSKRARRFHLALITLVGVSWFAVGPALGRRLGYCVLTDWQWRIKEARGQTDLPPSFVHLMFRWVGVEDADWMRILAGAVFVSALLLSLWLNLRDRAVGHARPEGND